MLKHRKKLFLAGAVVLVVILNATGVLPDLPDAEKLIEDVATGLGQWTYALCATTALAVALVRQNGRGRPSSRPVP